MIAYVFPGQGSQHKGMGANLFEAFPELVAKADEILGYSLHELCLQDPKDRLNLTQFTQPALFVVNALHYYQKCRQQEAPPQFVAGHSLGEYNALLAAEAFDFETGLRLVKKRGELMGRMAGGGMAAVVGLERHKLMRVLEGEGARDVDIANENAPSQLVISGPLERIEGLVAPMEAAGARRCLVLKVSAAFHSRYMAEAAEEFGQFLRGWRFQSPKIETLANVSGRPYAGDIHENLARQLREPVLWTETIRYLLARGISQIVEVGPGQVLTSLFYKIKREAEPLDLSAETDPLSKGKVPSPSVESKEAVSVDPERGATTSRRGADSPTPPPTSLVETSGAVKTSGPGSGLGPESLGSEAFRQAHGVRYAYMAGSMFRGISSPDMVIRMAKAGLLCCLGTRGSSIETIDAALTRIGKALGTAKNYGVNLFADIEDPDLEMALVDLYLRHDVRTIEAAAFMRIQPALVWFRFKGAHRAREGRPHTPRRLIAKVSRPEVAEAFMSPAPEKLLESLVQGGRLTREEAAIARTLPVADDICVTADCGGHTDRGSITTLLPAILRLRDAQCRNHGYASPIRIGAAGGIGTPEAAAVAFLMGADFVVTGSINQCTPEAAICDQVKDMLQGLQVQDTAYAPADDLFELGTQVQVVKRSVFFPARANKLYELFRHCGSLDDIDSDTRELLARKFFNEDLASVWTRVCDALARRRPSEVDRIGRNPKHKMAAVFKAYLDRAAQWAIQGEPGQKVNYQIYCGSAMGAFNSHVKGGPLEDWRHRHVDALAELIMQGAAETIVDRFQQLMPR
ncbi:[Acyl-carrier-protein] S-malonyltransferase [Sulfidibacter corallicola]|uniref:[acyl-carrier-protein] S-malonyltransferase n=1 Tax=Sulfidibacter corallicola TaxID=2818388 RepID=A0A8A4THU0_SULCO|nr:ACP S-malonyltransferase [Sulfidibacter corallicola]QTD49193.1 ACP S-malonyltransferase [Sulfidibacter corallicola]